MAAIMISIMLLLGVLYPFMNFLIASAMQGNTLMVGLTGFFMSAMVAGTGASIAKMRHRRLLARLGHVHAPRKTLYESVARNRGGVVAGGRSRPAESQKVMANGRLSQGGGKISNARKKANRKNQNLMKKQARSGTNLQDKGNAGVQQQVKFDPATGQVYLMEKSTGGAQGLITKS